MGTPTPSSDSYISSCLAIDCQASQFKFTEMAIQFALNTFCVSQEPSLLLSYHVVIGLHSLY